MRNNFNLGIIFILVGLGVVFDQLGLWNFGNILATWWPLILIGTGLSKLSRNSASKTSGITFIAIGVFFQIRELNIFSFNLMRFFWPAIIIAIGVSMLFPKTFRKTNHEFIKREINQDVVDNLALFSGVKTRNTSKNFSGGNLVAIFGGIDMDLSNASLTNEGANIDITSAFGGINIIVPIDWIVVVKGIPIFGGWSNKTYNKNYVNADAPVLTLHCFVAFGGVDIKNSDHRN
ncbi:MAG: LiaF transmembrane domain-containing protein [Clostridium sp.]|uniref:LiaF transmembrane domain-containing protein n=1 Tax=Clostridium sp. TaxID=1506 RepID=UPI003D6D0679